MGILRSVSRLCRVSNPELSANLSDTKVVNNMAVCSSKAGCLYRGMLLSGHLLARYSNLHRRATQSARLPPFGAHSTLFRDPYYPHTLRHRLAYY